MEYWKWVIGIIILIFLVIIISKFGSWKPRKNNWYRNKYHYAIGHQHFFKNVYIVIDNKKRRGSFKVIGDKVYYILGWKYSKKKKRVVPLKYCRFERDYEIIDTIKMFGQSGSIEFIRDYFLKIRKR